MWVRSGDGAGTLTGSAETYSFAVDASNYMNTGTYSFNRYAQDAACPSAAPWVASEGTYTVMVISVIEPCEKCCWDGPTSAWVNCYVLKAVTGSSWTGNTAYNAGARSDRDGRANTEAITPYENDSAIGLCKSLNNNSPGWYLPAYEEMVNMGTGTEHTPLNGLGGAGIFSTGDYVHMWSSTEYANNIKPDNTPGRYTDMVTDVVTVDSKGRFSHFQKKSGIAQRTCVWRPVND
jgi:hypothetical protein